MSASTTAAAHSRPYIPSTHSLCLPLSALSQMYTGDPSQATKYYTIAADYAATMVQYAWNADATTPHFMIGYKGSQGDGGDPDSWPMLVSATMHARGPRTTSG